MIIEQTVIIALNPNNKRHYMEKGYDYTNSGDKIEINVHELPRFSKILIKVSCDECGKIYETTYHGANKSNSHTCSKQCRYLIGKVEFKCHVCGTKTYKNKTQQNKSTTGYHFCSNKCVGVYNAEAKKNRIIKSCLICNKEYDVIPALAEKSVTCSISCQKIWQSKYLTGKNANNFKGGNRIKKCVRCGNEYKCNSPYQYERRKFCSKECKNIYWVENTLHNEQFRDNWFKGNEKYRQEMSEGKETSPERIVREWLEEHEIPFIQECGFFRRYFADFFIPKEKLVIEVMGDYWHASAEIYGEGKMPLNQEQKIQIERDKTKKEDFIKYGFRYFELWESDINENVEKLLTEIFPVTTTRRKP